MIDAPSGEVIPSSPELKPLALQVALDGMGDKIPPIPELPDSLRDRAHRGSLVLFIGAGVSQLAGCPGWEKFADEALKSLITNGKFSYSQYDQIKHLNPRVKLSIALALEREHNTQIDFRKLLHPKEPEEHPEGLRVYNALFRLGNIFVTTNYDEWLDKVRGQPTPSASPEASLADHAPALRMNVIHKVEEFTPIVLESPNTVVHLHGSVRDRSGMILTTQDYVKHYANDRISDDSGRQNQVLSFLKFLFQNRNILFIGYSLEELEILEYVFLKARSEATPLRESRHFILQGFFSHQEELQERLKSYYSESGITLISYSRDEKDWEQLVDVLVEYAGRLPASTPDIQRKKIDMEQMLDG